SRTRQNLPRVTDSTSPTVVDQSPELERFEREFGIRRRYWRPVLRVGQDYALRAGETARGVAVIFGGARIEGRVDGDLVVVFGPVTLASTAVVNGSFVVVGGTATVQPGAMVRDEVTVVGTGIDLPEGFIFGGEHVVIGTRALGAWMESVVPWVTYGLLWGRPIVASIGWVWSVLALFFVVYLMINLVAHEPVRATADALAVRPFGSFMTGLLVLLLAGPVSALLAVSIIGIAVIPFALVALVVAGIVGRVGVLRWIGNTVMTPDDPHNRLQGLRSFLIGFALVTITYMVPILGLMAWALFGVLGLGASVLAFMTAWRREHPKVEKPARAPLAVPEPEPPVAPAGAGGYAYAAPGFSAGPASFAGPVADAWQPAPEPAPAPSASELALFPRAAFLDRAAAFVIDLVLVLFVTELLEGPFWFRNDEVLLPVLLAYFIGFWAWKGTTIGGIVTNLRVAKISGGALSFLEALVRGLTSILSFGALGIGVLWILRSDVLATDGRPARQAWHDLAAGTYVVKVPKGYPLP
ncbi:MAG: RDD family protein, partial [Acidobacteria bacterium]|nr:RDD family protein [Acidobacteriota bacterium]